MLKLVRPNASLHDAWLASHAEWGPGEHEDGFGLDSHTDVSTAEGFADWVRTMHAEENSSMWDGPVVRGCFYRWIMDGDEVVGGIAARASDSEFVRRNGHVGYGIRPSARGRGIASWALAQVIRELFAARGLTRVLVVCEADNGASAATIERNGGNWIPRRRPGTSTAIGSRSKSFKRVRLRIGVASLGSPGRTGSNTSGAVRR